MTLPCAVQHFEIRKRILLQNDHIGLFTNLNTSDFIIHA